MEEHQSVCFLMGTQNISLSHACDKMKNIFLYFFTKLKTFLSFLFYLQVLLILPIFPDMSLVISL